MINAISMCVWTAAGVKAKISYIEQAWRKAHNRANETGQGVKEEEGIESFEEGCLKYCMFYFMLHDVLVDRSSSWPQLTTNSLYYTSDNPNSSDTSDDDDLSADCFLIENESEAQPKPDHTRSD